MAKELPVTLDAPPQQKASLPILIVDDEKHILSMLQDILEEEGISVLTASNGAAALRVVEQTPIALVLTDLMMPYVSGLDLANQLHRNPQTASIPLLLMSGAAVLPSSPIFAAVIHKPFAIETVVRTVRQFLPD